jgi:Zn-dependent alcohol dehydrogenase
MATTAARAIVAEAPGENFVPGNNWKLQDISVPTDLKDGELLVEMVASGICHTDLLVTSLPAGTPGIAYPSIVGHEGSGYVKAIGPNVKKNVKVGEPVLLSFDHCGDCESCKADHPAFCSTFVPKNIPCVPDACKFSRYKKHRCCPVSTIDMRY